MRLRLSRRLSGLRVRIGVLLFAGVLMASLGFYALLVTLTRQRLIQELDTRSRSTTGLLASRLTTTMVLRDRSELATELRQALRERDLVGIEVYDGAGTAFGQAVRDPSRWFPHSGTHRSGDGGPTPETLHAMERLHVHETVAPILRDPLRQSRPLAEVDELYGIEKRAAPVAEAPVGWVRTVYSTQAVDEAVRVASHMGLTIMLAALALWLVPLFGLLRVIARPLREASDLARSIAHGQLERRIPVRSEDELGTLAESLNTMAGALTEARREAHEEAEAMRRSTEAVVAIARGARQAHGVDDVFDVVAHQLREVTRSGGAALAAPDDEGFVTRFHRFDPAPPWAGIEPGTILEASLLRRLAAHGGPLRLDAQREETPLARGLIRDGFRAALLVPLFGGGDARHVLMLASLDPAAFPPAQIEVVVGLASHLGAALQAAALHGRLESAVTELEETRERLGRSERLRLAGEMASGVAHDFNNVLGAILGRAQLLRRRADDGTLQSADLVRALEIIERAAQDGGDTVRRLRQFGSGRPASQSEIVDLDGALRDAAEFTRTRWEDETNADGHEIAVTIVSEPGATVEGRGSEMREVFTNLILNAVDALPRGGHLRLETRVDEDRVIGAVEDDGVGMTAEVQKRIFDPFFTTKGDQGTGLGLSVVYGIVQSAGGEISVRSAPGRGTRVQISLPRALPSLAEVEVRAGAPHTAERLRVMVVDDEPAVRELLADIVTSLDHDCETFASGAEALDAYAGGHFHAVFTDLGMPGMSGWDVARSLRGRDAGVAIAIITGWGADVSPESLADVGADAVVSKPFTIEDIEGLLRLANERRERRAA